MKSLLWTVLVLCLAANVVLSLAVPGGPVQVVFSVAAGLGVLVCAAGLWVLRDRDAG